MNKKIILLEDRSIGAFLEKSSLSSDFWHYLLNLYAKHFSYAKKIYKNILPQELFGDMKKALKLKLYVENDEIYEMTKLGVKQLREVFEITKEN